MILSNLKVKFLLPHPIVNTAYWGRLRNTMWAIIDLSTTKDGTKGLDNLSKDEVRIRVDKIITLKSRN